MTVIDRSLLADMAVVLERQNWTYAKTMPLTPHFYIVRRNWHETLFTFDQITEAIHVYGYDDPFYGQPYRAIDLNDFKYWLGTKSFIPTTSTTIINRKPISPKLHALEDILP